MRIYGPSSTRAFPLDRNPTTIANGGGLGGPFAGGSNQVLATYTVPAARRAFVSIANATAVVAVALAAGQTAVVSVLVTPSGGAQTLVAQDAIGPAAVADTHAKVDAVGVYLKAGDLIETRLVTTAGAGTVNAGGGLSATEYDT